jgi:hypothetical protein
MSRQLPSSDGFECSKSAGKGKKHYDSMSSKKTRLLVTELETRVTPDVTNLTQSTVFTWTSFGTNALIQAVSAANDGDVITLDTVGGSDYLSPGQILKSLTIYGPNSAINPNTGVRVPEVNINTTAQPLSIASDKSLSVRGLSFSTPGGRGALTVFATNYTVDFQNNIVTDQAPTYRSVYVSTSNASLVGYTSATISNNRILNNAPDTAAIRLSTGNNGVVSNNVISGAYSGVQLNSSAGVGATNPVVTNNHISNTVEDGIDIRNNVSNATVTYNTIVNANTSNTTRRGAIRIAGFSNAGDPGPTGTLTITNNLVSASNGGVVFSTGPYPALSSLLINTNVLGVNSGTPAGGSGTATDATVNFSGNYFGTTSPATIESSLYGTRAAVVQSFLTSDANLRTAALSKTSNSWGFDPDISIVQVNVPQTAATSGLSKVDGRIQSGIDRAVLGMFVNVAQDTYPDSPALNRNVILRPLGTGTGTVGVAGGTLSTGQLSFDVNGKTAGTQYDRVNTSAPLNLTGTAFSLNLGYVANYADFYDLVVGSNTGTFSGLTNGATLTADYMSVTYTFQIFYNPIPNVVRLVNIGPGLPTQAVVNEDWSSLTNGQTGFSAQFPSEIYGITAFSDIASALAVVGPGATIIVAGSGANGPSTNDYAGFTLNKNVSFEFVADTDNSENTVTLGGATSLASQPLNVLLNQASGLINFASSSTGTINASAGTPSVSITSSVSGQGSATLTGAIGGTTAVSSLNISKLNTVSITSAKTNGTGNAIDISTSGSITVGSLDAGTADVKLQSATAAILDGNGASLNVNANLITVSAGTTIDLDTNVSSLVLTSAGNAVIREADGLSISTVDAGTSTFDLSSQGAVTQTGIIKAANVRLQGNGDFTLTSANNLIGTTTNPGVLAAALTGNLSFKNSGANGLTVGTVLGSNGITITGGSNSATVESINSLTVNHAITAPGLVALNFGTANGNSDATINAAVSSTGSTLTITGGTGNNVVTVNAALTSSPVSGTQIDTGSGDDTIAVLGSAGQNTFDVNKTVAASVIARNGQFKYVNVETLNLVGDNSAGTFTLGYGIYPGASGFLPANVNINAGTVAGDVATIYMPAGDNETNSTSAKVNWLATKTSAAVRGAENVNYTTNLEQLTIQGNTGRDAFFARPDATTKITINGSDPVSPPGDSLQLDILGLTTGINTSFATIPDGKLTGTAFAQLNWTSIESLPVPVGLGGSFDFGSSTSPVQETGIGTNADPVPTPSNTAVGWTRVTGLTTFAGNSNLYGWDAPVNDFVRWTGGVNQLPAGPNRDLLQDGAYWASGPANKRNFQVAVAPGGTVQVTVFVGDQNTVGGTSGQVWIEGVQKSTYSVPDGKFYTERFTMTDNGDGILNISFYQPALDSWSLANGVDVRPIDWIAPVYLARNDGETSPVGSDGITVDKYNFTNAQPNQTFTITTSQGKIVNSDGSPVTDADVSLNGIQFKVNASGNASVYLLRPTGSTSASINIVSAYGDSALDGDGKMTGTSFGPFVQNYFVPSSPPPPGSPPAPSRNFDFNSTTNVTQGGYTPVAWNQQFKASTLGGNGVGWLEGNVGFFDRTNAGAGFTGTNSLNRDGHASQTAKTFVTELATTTTYTVTVWLGDPAPTAQRPGMTVSVGTGYGTMVGSGTVLAGSTPGTAVTINPTLPYTPTLGAGTVYFSSSYSNNGYTVPANSFIVSPTIGGTIALQFIATTNSLGQLGIRLGTAGASPNWWSAQGMTFTPVSPLLPQEGFVANPIGLPKLSDSELKPIFDQAISNWVSAGLTGEQLANLAEVQFSVANLPNGELGIHSNGQIVIDDDGAGRGWSTSEVVDPNRYDLLTVVMHELGHELGLQDQPSDGQLMSESLGLGESRMATWQDVEEVIELTVAVDEPAPVALLPLVSELVWGPQSSTAYTTTTNQGHYSVASSTAQDEVCLHGVPLTV